MSAWIAVPEGLLAAAGEVLAPGKPELGRTTDVPRSLVEAIVEYLSEDLGCDHSVGICMCNEIDIVNGLTLALDGKADCPGCHGDGFVYSEEKYAEAVLDYQAAMKCSLNEARATLSDLDGMVECPVCGGSRSVPVDDLEAKKLEADGLVSAE